MKKTIFLTFLIAFILAVFNVDTVFAEAKSDDLVYDGECVKTIMLGYYLDENGEKHDAIGENGQPFCNDTCRRGSIFDENNVRKKGYFCPYNSTEATKMNVEIDLPHDKTNPDDPSNIVRAAVYAMLGFAGFAVVVYGLYGWYLRSASGGEEEKLRLSTKVFKNAIIGGLIVVGAIIIAQIVFSLLGVTEGIFDFNFLPTIDDGSGDVKEERVINITGREPPEF